MRAKEDHDQQEVHDGADEQYITMLAGSIKDTNLTLLECERTKPVFIWY